MIGIFTSVSSPTTILNSTASPRRVRSPQRTSTSASSFAAASRSRYRPVSASPQCTSPTAAMRILPSRRRSAPRRRSPVTVSPAALPAASPPARRSTNSRLIFPCRFRSFVPHIACRDLADDRQRFRPLHERLALIAKAPFVHIDREAEPRDHRPASHLLPRAPSPHVVPCTLQQLVEHPRRHRSLELGIHVAEDLELCEQERPVLISLVHEPPPIHGTSHARDQVHDVGHVLPVPLADEEPVPEQLFRRGNAHGRRSQDRRPAVRVPIVIDEREPVPHAVDDVHEVSLPWPLRLRQPVRLLEAGLEACSLEHGHRPHHVTG